MLSPDNYEFLKIFRNGGVYKKNLSRAAIDKATEYIDEGLLKARSHDPNNMFDSEYYLTAKGDDALSEFEQSRNDYADTKAYRRFNKKIAILSVCVPLISFIGGIIVEHCADVVAFFSSLFS